MRSDDMAATELHQPDPQVLHDFDPGQVFDLEPVDSVTVTTLIDNVTDPFMPDQGPAHRPLLPIFRGGRQPATTMEGGDVPEVPLADGGFSVLVDDQALILDIKDKGLLMITGCGHAGIVNICRYARRLTDERPLHAVMGGFHLNGPIFEPLIPQVLDDLGALAPHVGVPAHCIGWRAQHAIGARFGEAFIPNNVGTRFEL